VVGDLDGDGLAQEGRAGGADGAGGARLVGEAGDFVEGA